MVILTDISKAFASARATVGVATACGHGIRLATVPGVSARAAVDSSLRHFHHKVLACLTHAGVPFLVGGSVAMARHAGVTLRLEDLQLFMRLDDWRGAEAMLKQAEIDTHVAFSHWLVKVHDGTHTLDIIHNGGNGLTPVDRGWFDRAIFDDVAGLQVRLCPPEELIWSKAFVMERDQFEGADVIHLIRAHSHNLDWDRLLELFERYPRVLLAHLLLCGFVYPGGPDAVPPWILAHLWSQIGEGGDERTRHAHLCRGTVLSREQYLVDVERWGYTDARICPFGTMTRQEIERWTPRIGPSLAGGPSDVPAVPPASTKPEQTH